MTEPSDTERAAKREQIKATMAAEKASRAAAEQARAEAAGPALSLDDLFAAPPTSTGPSAATLAARVARIGAALILLAGLGIGLLAGFLVDAFLVAGSDLRLVGSLAVGVLGAFGGRRLTTVVGGVLLGALVIRLTPALMRAAAKKRG